MQKIVQYILVSCIFLLGCVTNIYLIYLFIYIVVSPSRGRGLYCAQLCRNTEQKDGPCSEERCNLRKPDGGGGKHKVTMKWS